MMGDYKGAKEDFLAFNKLVKGSKFAEDIKKELKTKLTVAN
jgi:hypothetical protein